MKNLFIAQEIAAFEKAKKVASETGLPVDRIVRIKDFTDVLERQIKEELQAMDEPIFTNPISGKAASTVFAILGDLDYNCRVTVGGDS